MYDGTPQLELYHFAKEADNRLRASGFYDSSRTHRVFFVRTGSLAHR